MQSDFDREALRAAGRRAVDLFAENFDGPPEHRVEPLCTRNELRELFAGTLGDDGVGVDCAIDDFARLVLPNSMRTPHPLYLGLINTSPLPGGTLGDLLVSTLNNNGGAFQQGPAMAAAESEVIREFARLFGLDPDHTRGLFLPGGSYATLHGLLLARSAHFPQWQSDGPTALPAAPVAYTSDVSHFSVARAARAIGIGDRNAVAVPSRGRGAMDAGKLAELVHRDRAAGKRPFLVAATMGTTGTAALDPLAEIVDICQREKLWLHVDACYGGAALLLDEWRARFAGIEQADSIAVDPHKWFYMPMTAALVLTQHMEVEERAFGVNATYIPNDGHLDPYQRGVPTSRRCMGGMVWFALRAHGWKTIRDAVRRNIDLTRKLESLLAERGFTVMPDGELSIACARWEPPGRSPEQIDALQGEITKTVLRGGTAWFATVRHADRTWLRFNILNLHTREAHLHKLVDALTQAAHELTQVGG